MIFSCLHKTAGSCSDILAAQADAGLFHRAGANVSQGHYLHQTNRARGASRRSERAAGWPGKLCAAWSQRVLFPVSVSFKRMLRRGRGESDEMKPERTASLLSVIIKTSPAKTKVLQRRSRTKLF